MTEQKYYMHVKGGVYEIIARAKMQTKDWVTDYGTEGVSYPVDMKDVVVYRSLDTGMVWVRPDEEFFDGRFTAIDPAYDLSYWKQGTHVIEQCMLKAKAADPRDVPFPLLGNEARIWHDAQLEAYRHALEMMGFTPALERKTKDG